MDSGGVTDTELTLPGHLPRGTHHGAHTDLGSHCGFFSSVPTAALRAQPFYDPHFALEMVHPIQAS